MGIQPILEKHARDRFGLMSILGDIQAKYGFLPADALRAVAEGTGRSLVDVYAVATFYRAFSLKPRGNHLCSVCVGTACHVRGSRLVAGEVQKRLGVGPGETTHDRELTFETVNCLGACALGPIVVIDGRTFSNVEVRGVGSLLTRARNGEAAGGFDRPTFAVDVSCPCCNHSLMNGEHLIDGNPSIHVTASFGLDHGWLRLSSVYGSYTIESEHEIPMDVEASFFCPHCHSELVGASPCPECGAGMVPMLVRGGGVVQVCGRRGCKSHRLDIGRASP